MRFLFQNSKRKWNPANSIFGNELEDKITICGETQMSLLHLPNNRIRKLIRRRGAADVAGTDFAFCENFQHRTFDLVGSSALLDVA
jgi:hypothetical protein